MDERYRRGASGAPDLEGERERAMVALTRAFSQDALSLEEYESGAGRVQAARSREEIEGLLALLPAEAAARPPSASRGPGSLGPSVYAPAREEKIVCNGSARLIEGSVLLAPSLVLELAHSSLKLDYGGLELPRGVYELSINAVHSSCTIILPEGAEIENRLALQYSSLREPRRGFEEPASGLLFRLSGNLVHSSLRLLGPRRRRLGLFGRRR